jgi:hypothetical protein
MNETQMNWFAALVLLSWPAVSLWLYRTQPLNRATVCTILGGQFLLPTGTLAKLAPGIPQLDKTFIPNFAALLGCALFARQGVRFVGRIGLAEVLLFMLIGGPFITSMLNGDVVFAGPFPLPALTWYDAASAFENEFALLLPFFIGRQFLRNAVDIEEILRIMVIAELLYSIPMLVEVRLSPHLHDWVYGYPAGNFLQQMRNGGYRPMVFIGHGLLTAFFMMMAVIAAAALWRARTRVAPASPAVVTAYLSVVLVLCKTLGALLYAAVMVPLIWMTRPRLQLRVAVLLAVIALAYPFARMADLVPTGMLLEWSSYDVDREGSLAFRFFQEGQLLEKASQRFVFGWGGFGRARVFDEDGKDLSTTDGRWIIVLGAYGLVGFIAEFGLLTFPIFRMSTALRFAESDRDRIFLAALTLIMAVNVVDLLPNAPLTPWTWLICGALFGRAEALRAGVRRPKKPGVLVTGRAVR